MIFLVAMSLAGVRAYNADQLEHQQAAVSFWHYLTTGAFVEAVFENWESEFLQMGMYVVLTAYLFQRGSSESKRSRGKRRRTPTRATPTCVRRCRGRCAGAGSC